MRRNWRRSLLCWLALSPLLVLILFPFAVMLSTALKATPEVMSYPPHWIPRELSFQGFRAVAGDIGLGLANSLAIAFCATAIALALAIPAAYATARLTFRGRGAYRMALLVSQMLAPVLLILGLFRLAASVPLGDGTLVDTRIGVIAIYAAFQIAFGVWMLSAYFGAIPRDIEEAAWIDGCTRLGAIRRIFLPLAVPAVAVTAIVTFVGGWNEFVVAFTLLRSQSKQTVTVLVVNLVAGRYTVEWNEVMAATLIATVPVAIVFALLQKRIVRGLTLGAVK